MLPFGTQGIVKLNQNLCDLLKIGYKIWVWLYRAMSKMSQQSANYSPAKVFYSGYLTCESEKLFQISQKLTIP